MPLENFIIGVFCWVEVAFQELTGERRLRSRGCAPKLSDREVITMELVGEFLGIDTDQGIWEYFRWHGHEWFPGLGSRASFAKQAANLWLIKQLLHRRLAGELGALSDTIHMVDGFPIPVCLFQRAKQSQVFKGEAEYGYCAAKDQIYYGFRGHVVINFNGVISGLTVTSACGEEREALWELIDPLRGLLLGDKGYLSVVLKQALAQHGLELETPLRANMKETRNLHFVQCLKSTRRRVETVIGQLTERFHLEKVWARDLWHLTNRVIRKILAHTIGIYFNRLLGREDLQFSNLIQA